MLKYKDIDGDSWIIEYEIWVDFIDVKFNSWKVYTYSYSSAWEKHIEDMKILASVWNWLNSYIMKYCRDLYVK